MTVKAKDVIVSPMAKRTFLQVEMSEEYKTELQRLLGVYMPMANEVKRLLDKEYPSLAAITAKEISRPLGRPKKSITPHFDKLMSPEKATPNPGQLRKVIGRDQPGKRNE